MFDKLIQLGLSFALLSFPVINSINNPARAQSLNDNSYKSQVNSILPRNTSILIRIIDPITIDVKAEETLPTLAILAAPLYDRQGRQLIPQGVPVTITLKPSSSKTAQVYANSIIVGSLTIPIKAESEEIRGRKITLSKNSQRISPTAQLGENMGSLVGYAFNPALESNSNQASPYYALGGLVGGLVDLATGEENLRIVALRAGHTLALKLKEDVPIDLPTKYPQQFPSGFNHPSYFVQNTSSVQAPFPNSRELIVSNHPQEFSSNRVHLYNADQLMNSSSNSVPINGSIHRLNGQPVSSAILTRLRSVLAQNYLVEAECGTIPQQVTIKVNQEFIICGYPNTKYTPGNYNLTVDEL